MPLRINPTVKKAQVYDSRTGEMVQEEGNFTPDEIQRGAGRFPGGIQIVGSGGSGSHSGASGQRFGNPGGRMAPTSPNALEANGRPGMGSLSSFYASQKSTVDPFTGLPLNPSGHDLLQQRAQNERGGFQGFQDQAMQDAYRGAVAARDPFAVAGIRQMGNDARAQRMALEKLSSSKPISQMSQPLTNQMAGGVLDMFPFLMRREHGGPIRMKNPYLVNEKGPEMFVDKEGHSAMIGDGSPSVAAFPVDGKVVPTKDLWRLPALADGGKAKRGTFPTPLGDIPSANTADYISDVPNIHGTIPPVPTIPGVPGVPRVPNFNPLGIGGPLRETQGFKIGEYQPMTEDEVNQRYAQSSPFLRGLYNIGNFGTNMVRGLGSAIASPFMSPSASAAADYMRQHNIPIPEGLIPPEPLMQAPNVEPVQPITPLGEGEASISTGYTPDNMAARRAALSRTLAEQARQRMTDIPNVRTLSPQTSESQGFLTPYGTASVSYGQPKQEAIIEGLPAGEYFQRAANRQGANRFAQPEKGTEGSDEMIAKRRENLRKATRA